MGGVVPQLQDNFLDASFMVFNFREGGEWTENLRKEYVIVIERFFIVPLPLLSFTYRRAIQDKKGLGVSFQAKREDLSQFAGLIPFAIHLFGLFFIPESPRWLAKIGRKMDFEVALQKLHGLDTDISEEVAEIQVIITGLNTTVIDKALYAVNLFDFLTLVRPEHVKLLLLLEEVVDWCSGGSASGDSGCQWRRG
ncbi:hypothetical protein ACFE04_008148 [Oxalis oulophora]